MVDACESAEEIQEILGQIGKIRRKYEPKIRKINDIGSLGILLGAVITLSTALFPNSYRNAQPVIDYNNVSQTAQYLRDLKDKLPNQQNLRYQSESIKPFLDDVFASTETQKTSLDRAIEAVESDRDRLRETREFREYDDANRIRTSISSSGITLAFLSMGYMAIHGFAVQRKKRKALEALESNI